MQPPPYVHAFSRDAAARASWRAVSGFRLVAVPDRPGTAEPDEEIAARALRAQVSFVGALFAPEPSHTFCLRYVSWPDARSVVSGRVEVGLFAVSAGPTRAGAIERARALHAELTAVVGGFLPDHEWAVLDERSAFRRLWAPFDLGRASVAEIRRREDVVAPTALEVSRRLGFLDRGSKKPSASADRVYIVHPFVPTGSTFEPLLRVMLLQSRPLLLQVTLAPVTLTDGERAGFLRGVAACEWHEQQKPGAGRSREPLPVVQRRAAAMAESLTGQLLRLVDAPFALGVSLASPGVVPASLLEAVGIEISEPVGLDGRQRAVPATHLLAGGYDVAVPSGDAEAAAARDNLRFAESEAWGWSAAPPGLARLRRLVDAREATAAFRLPVAGRDGLPGLAVRAARSRPMPRSVAAHDALPAAARLYLGENRYLGFAHPVHLAEQDRAQHMYVVGQTGTGKSTLLRTMIAADIDAGRGVAVIDPHGDLFAETLAAIPPSRAGDVVVVDPSDVEYPVGLNLLECGDEAERYFVVREMRAIMERLIEDQYPGQGSEYAGPIFYQHMQMNMLLVMANPDRPGTMLDFHDIFQSDDGWRAWLPLVWSDDKLRRWVGTNLPTIKYTSRFQDISLGEYISSKFEDFVFDPRLRLIFGQRRSTIDLADIMDTGKILLVNLSKGLLGEANARFLGMVLMARLQAAAMRRIRRPLEARRRFCVYIDEFQALATQNFALMLAEARKFGVALVLANQFLAQIKDRGIAQAIFGNVGTLVSFRLGHADAQLLEAHMLPAFTRHDLANLPNWQACVKPTVAGQVASPFSLSTVRPQGAAGASVPAAEIVARSRARYGRPRAEVSAEISAGPAPLRPGDDRAAERDGPW